ncbi:aspartyl-phosphate phosphatase Spo0E family protein [Tumebacillus sp. ITR2]|uniref:Aspartyl-phosphate phosphatase Spo0E family protein n=2 Tax=Tumebacillus amylolyticus TaxID=2801339 RepID=A0ABS1J7B3_9BACL|nr:aspartyl-phosphate phosphatase Spo0E family protein [Tumebacillus amylolyticus]
MLPCFFVKGVTVLEHELELETLINQLRQQMTQAYEEKGTLTDACVIAISQELDLHIVKAQRLKSSEKTTDDGSHFSTLT